MRNIVAHHVLMSGIMSQVSSSAIADRGGVPRHISRAPSFTNHDHDKPAERTEPLPPGGPNFITQTMEGADRSFWGQGGSLWGQDERISTDDDERISIERAAERARQDAERARQDAERISLERARQDAAAQARQDAEWASSNRLQSLDLKMLDTMRGDGSGAAAPLDPLDVLQPPASRASSHVAKKAAKKAAKVAKKTKEEREREEKDCEVGCGGVCATAEVNIELPAQCGCVTPCSVPVRVLKALADVDRGNGEKVRGWMGLPKKKGESEECVTWRKVGSDGRAKFFARACGQYFAKVFPANAVSCGGFSANALQMQRERPGSRVLGIVTAKAGCGHKYTVILGTFGYACAPTSAAAPRVVYATSGTAAYAYPASAYPASAYTAGAYAARGALTAAYAPRAATDVFDLVAGAM